MSNEISFFFDNDQKNLSMNRNICQNVIPIKVPGTDDSNQLKSRRTANFITYYNSLDIESKELYAALMNILYNKENSDELFNLFDPICGLNSDMMNNFIKFVDNSNYKVNICIFDIDRTIIKSEGLIFKSINKILDKFKQLSSKSTNIFKRLFQKKLKPTDYSKPVTSIDDIMYIIKNCDLSKINTDMQSLRYTLAKIYLGGENRLNELTRFFNFLSERDILFSFLTNNRDYCFENSQDGRRCTQELNMINDTIMNEKFNWLFYEILVGAKIIGDDSYSMRFFIENQIVYNNKQSPDATYANKYKYNRIHDMEILIEDSVDPHLIKQSCLNDLKNPDFETKMIKSQIEGINIITGGKKMKTRKPRTKTPRTRKMKTRKTKRNSRK